MSNIIVATNYGEMTQAQKSLEEWATAKLEAEHHAYADMQHIRDRLQASDLSVERINRQLAQCRRRVRFYAKVGAAVRAGYTIIPSMWSNVFAVKTQAKDRPAAGWKRNVNDTDLAVRSHPVGEGRYVNPVTDWESEITHYNDKGKAIERHRATGFQQVEFPVEACRPEIIDAATAAMGTKIFDALGIVTGQSDPMIVGHIKNHRQYGQDVLFMIAYFVDTDTL